MSKQRYRVEVERVIGKIAFEVEVDGPSRGPNGTVPGDSPETATARLLASLKADPKKTEALFDAHSRGPNGDLVVTYIVDRVVLIDPPLVVGGPHRQPPNHDARPEKESHSG